MECLSNYHEDRPNQHENSHKLCDEKGHPVVNLMESQWKLSNKMMRISQWGESHCRINASEERNPKEQDYENDSLGSE